MLLCCGKIYWELLKEREDLGRHDVAIVRVEQLYPTPIEPLRKALESYADGTPVYWVQEEPENQGAWRYMFCRFGTDLFDRLPFSGVYRRASSSPATGSTNAQPGTKRTIDASVCLHLITDSNQSFSGRSCPP